MVERRTGMADFGLTLRVSLEFDSSTVWALVKTPVTLAACHLLFHCVQLIAAENGANSTRTL